MMLLPHVTRLRTELWISSAQYQDLLCVPWHLPLESSWQLLFLITHYATRLEPARSLTNVIVQFLESFHSRSEAILETSVQTACMEPLLTSAVVVPKPSCRLTRKTSKVLWLKSAISQTTLRTWLASLRWTRISIMTILSPLEAISDSLLYQFLNNSLQSHYK